ncbi:hypothetical protein K435DRAFT_763266 [Dendrothele bispora CBS 962.96]|uniref:Uncharacterized protein n=1 Tax=Dendrothele bispora (strain CBS 962.96) TaxID=1314807 RepID=A0A4V4HDB4_DENBC|nr:hypothetical protein K435DRAFT_763266 [Dendrothele bispora CBS 962.96]
MLYYIWGPLLAVVSYVFQRSPSNSINAIDCLQSSTDSLEAVVDCLDKYTVAADYYNQESYTLSQPSSTELTAFTDLVSSLLYVDDNCTSLHVPDSLSQHFRISLLSDRGESKSYCVLHEYTSQNGYYVKGWGFMAVPASRTPSTDVALHFSAPHPAYDLNTPQQAASLFTRTSARSLLITGRSRLALRNSTSCIRPSSNKTTYYVTDPVHDDNELFNVASKIIYKWQQAQGGCPSATCAFIQMHGKGASACSTDQMFLSSGLARSSSSLAWYTDDIDRPIKRLKANLQQVFPSWNVSMPSDSSCSLTATENIFGRFINGIDAAHVCTTGSNASLATGEFIHIEQAAVSRSAESYENWTKALKDTFRN